MEKNILRTFANNNPVEFVRDEPHSCPVCGQYIFEYHGSDDICPVCGWEDDLVAEMYPDEDGCGNEMSLNQAIEAYKNGEKVR